MDALSVVSCVVLKSVMKRDYNLSPEQCATFNPRDIRQERIGRSMAMFNRDKEDGQTGSVRNRFPAAEWLEKVLPLVERFSQPAEIAAYIRELTDADPWDDSRTRHEHKIDALEGRRGRGKALPKASPKARGRGQAKKQEPKKKGRRWDAQESRDYFLSVYTVLFCFKLTHIFWAPCNKSKQIRRGYASDEDSDYEVPSPSL